LPTKVILFYFTNVGNSSVVAVISQKSFEPGVDLPAARSLFFFSLIFVSHQGLAQKGEVDISPSTFLSGGHCVAQVVKPLYDEMTDGELMDLVTLDDNRVALTVLYNRYAANIKKYMWGHLNPSLIQDDILQEAFVIVLQKRHLFRVGSAFNPWFRTIVTNLVILHYRQREYLRIPSHLDFETPPTPITDHEAKAFLLKLAESFISVLPPLQRETFERHQILNESFESIAQSLGTTVVSIRKRFSRASRRLREMAESSLPKDWDGDWRW
jgi:RNA polymerase sigma factor (sigma-70 family)